MPANKMSAATRKMKKRQSRLLKARNAAEQTVSLESPPKKFPYSFRKLKSSQKARILMRLNKHHQLF